MENEKEARRAQPEKQISAAATLRLARSGGGIVRYMRANQVRAARQKNPTRASRQDIDERALCWPDRFVIARSPGT